MSSTQQIKQKAVELGFDLVGVTDVSPLQPEEVNHFINWLDAGYAGGMDWLHSNIEKRTNPAKLLTGAKSVIVVGLGYKPPATSAKTVRAKAAAVGRVAPYACYEDYHQFIKKQLRKLVDFIIDITGHGFKFQICVDSVPLLERALAVRAGLGFIGRNHMLVNPQLGPQIFLGEIITNLELDCSDNPLAGNNCDSCGKCITACPTGALRPDGCFDATKCISYLTIESDTEIPSDLAPKMGNHLFGCSDCLLACPHQQKSPACKNPHFAFYPDRAELDLNEVLNLSEGQFQICFANSPILRTGLSHLKRVAQICLQNSLVCPKPA